MVVLPPVPAGTMAASARKAPMGEFSFETPGEHYHAELQVANILVRTHT
jgi:hypothetical protein